MDSNWISCVIIGPYAFLWVLMGRFRSLCVLLHSNGSFWVSMGPYSFLRNLMGPYRSLCVLMGFYRFL